VGRLKSVALGLRQVGPRDQAAALPLQHSPDKKGNETEPRNRQNYRCKSVKGKKKHLECSQDMTSKKKKEREEKDSSV
jgi:hypothetical protein